MNLKRLLSVPGIAIILIFIIGLATLLKGTEYITIPFWIMATMALAIILTWQGQKNGPENRTEKNPDL